jgi:hypothetical protein
MDSNGSDNWRGHDANANVADANVTKKSYGAPQES